MNDELFTNAIIKLSSEMGSLRTSIESLTEVQSKSEDRYDKGRDRNIQAQKEIKESIDRVGVELNHKMDEREYRFIVLINMMVKNWRMTVVIFVLMATSAFVASKWEELLSAMGGMS